MRIRLRRLGRRAGSGCRGILRFQNMYRRNRAQTWFWFERGHIVSIGSNGSLSVVSTGAGEKSFKKNLWSAHKKWVALPNPEKDPR